jgi:glutathione S-transferase
MTPIITTFENSPDGGRGLARDMPVRWALEEVGRPYDVRRVSFQAMKQPPHRALQPFGQIPTYEEDGVVLFESGAIVLHIAQRHTGLLPGEAGARARAISWMFAAVSLYLEADRPWHDERLPMVDERIRVRLRDLAARLGHAEWLDGEFSAGDLMMVQVLRRLSGPGMLDEFPSLREYVARGEARPAFRRAYEAQARRD